MKIPLLAAGTVAGVTVMVPSPAVRQLVVTVAGVASSVVSELPWNRSVAAKVDEPANPGAVAGTMSVNAVAPGRIPTTYGGLEEFSEQAEFAQVRDDGAPAVQPVAMDSVTKKYEDGGLAGAVKLKVSVVGCDVNTVLGEDETVSVPVSARVGDPEPAAATAGQARAAAPTTATAMAPTPYHRRDRHMPAPTYERHVPPSRRGRPDR